MDEQLRLAVPAGPRAKGRWERRAESLLRQLRADGHLKRDTAGYGDALRMAGQDRDRVEHDPDATAWARNISRTGWDHALSRIVAPPAAAIIGTDGDDNAADTFHAIDHALDPGRAAVGNPPESRTAD